jgi:hypothetical protein
MRTFLDKDAQWSYPDLALLRLLLKNNEPIKSICQKLGRTEEAVHIKAQELGIFINPHP